jgi:hypothetical protein
MIVYLCTCTNAIRVSVAANLIIFANDGNFGEHEYALSLSLIVSLAPGVGEMAVAMLIAAELL